MSADNKAKAANAPSTPLKTRTGRCLAHLCKGCSAYEYHQTIAGYLTCRCSHSQGIHDRGETT